MQGGRDLPGRGGAVREDIHDLQVGPVLQRQHFPVPQAHLHHFALCPQLADAGQGFQRVRGLLQKENGRERGYARRPEGLPDRQAFLRHRRFRLPDVHGQLAPVQPLDQQVFPLWGRLSI